MAAPKKGAAASAEDTTLSKLGEDVLRSCRETLIDAQDLSPDQIERLMGIATGAKKPRASDLQAILEEEGELA